MADAGSGIEGMRAKSRFAEYVASRLKHETLKLVDVGCAGGLAPGWRTFGDRLSAVGFDTDAKEVERLNAAEANPRVHYQAGWVGLPDDHPLKLRIGTKAYWHHWPSGRHAYERTYNIRGSRKEGRGPSAIEDYIKDDVLNQDWLTTPWAGFDLDYARAFEVFPVSDTETVGALDVAPGRAIHLPPYLKAADFYDADFLKLDIDGPDYEVLRSLTDLLAQPTLLGVALEVCFFGSHDANDNSFHNMDRLMREKGFDLFGLSLRTYASAALPFPYLDVHPSMNIGGRPGQGDAIYIRDLGSRVRAETAALLSNEKLSKAAALLALFNLPDHASELLLVHRERLSQVLDVDQALDLLAEEIQTEGVSIEGYRAYVKAFEDEDPRFYDIYGARNAWMDKVLQAADRAPAVAARAEALQCELDEMRSQDQSRSDELRQTKASLEDAERRMDALTGRLQAIEMSTSWRLTGPLRRIISAFKGRRA